MRFQAGSLVSTALLLVFVQSAHAIPQLINYQGILANGGVPVTTPTTVQFRLWTGAAGGNQLWTESQLVTPDAGGRFNVLLGSVNPIPDSAFGGAAAYLALTIAPDPEMTPRSRVASAAYAYRVGSLEGAAAGTVQGNLVLVSAQGDSIVLDPGAIAAIRAIDNALGPYLEVRNDSATGPVLAIRIDGNQLLEQDARQATYSSGVSSVFTPDLQVGSDGVIVYGDSDSDTLGHLDRAGLTVRDTTGNTVSVSSTNAEFRNQAGTTVAKIGEAGIQVVASTGFAKGVGGAIAVDTIFAFDPLLHSLRIGLGNVASGLNSIAVGANNTASGLNSVAIGSDNFATGEYSVTFGTNNVADTGQATVGGGENNQATNLNATVAGGIGNRAMGDASTVAGGFANEAREGQCAIGGGFQNIATSGAATISGGAENEANGNASAVGGGVENVASGDWSVISGGTSNQTAIGAPRAAIGGGWENSVTGQFGTVPGGRDNTADGYAFAAGRRAKAAHWGTFVWGDTTDADVSSTTENQFIVRATGGVIFYTDSVLSTGVTLANGSGSWGSVSDRAVKQNIRPVDEAEILAKVAGLDVSRWNYKAQGAGVEHVGPMAQDFYAAFGVGEDERHITSVDADGVALAAIKALNRKNAELERSVAALEARLAELEALLISD